MGQPYMVVPAQGSDPADEWHRLGFDSQMSSNGITDPQQRQAKLAEAQHRYQQALRLDPRHALATQNLAIVYAQSNLLNDALLTIERACLLDGVHGVIQMNRGLMALEANRVEEALEATGKAVEIAPDDVNAMLARAMAFGAAGRPADAMPLYDKMLGKEPKHGAAGTNICFLQTLTDSTPADLLKQRKRFWEANKFTGKAEPHRNDRDLDEKCRTCKGQDADCKICGGGGIVKMRPLRIGYVSGDFKQHSASFIFARVVQHHSKDFDVFLYSCLPVNPEDVRTKKFMDVAGKNWRDISTMSDEDADKLIRKDRIDILVDLAAHTSGGRLPLFMRKPAPVQVTAWGFAHGTGCPEIDYFLADPIAVPEEERKHYAEKVVDLPCLVTMDPPTDYNLKGTSLPPIKKNGYFTFGCYARYEKMSDRCIEACAEILRQVPDSKVEFKDFAYHRPYSIRRIMGLMKGVEPERLLFSLATTHPDHMLAYQQADICLDPFPHCGGIVSLEQLWMGVPIITLYGKQPAGRNTSSVLTAMGRTDWIAKTVDEYIAKAVEWSERTKELAEARKTLRQELIESPVVKGYVEAVETEYKKMWRIWCES